MISDGAASVRIDSAFRQVGNGLGPGEAERQHAEGERAQEPVAACEAREPRAPRPRDRGRAGRGWDGRVAGRDGIG